MTGRLELGPSQWASLLDPIPGQDACGVSLRYEGAYDEVRRFRKYDDETLAQGVWETTPRKADWVAVAAVCTEALAHTTKDLQLAAWLLEAWIHLHGFAGAAAGLALVHGLCEQFWGDLHPRPAEGDLEFRYSVVRWINEKLVTALKLAPLTAPQGGDVAVRTWADRESLQQLSKPGSPARGREGEGDDAAALDRALFQKSLALTPTEWLEQQRQEAARIVHWCGRIGQFLDEGEHPDSPGLVGFLRAAQSIEEYLAGVVARRQPGGSGTWSGGAPTANQGLTDLGLADLGLADPGLGHPGLLGPGPTGAASIAALARQTGAEPPPLPLAALGPIESRQQAYQLLSAVAEYLSVTEPHSPVPYLVRRAVDWGSLGLAELLPELVRDAGNLEEVQRLLQIRAVANPGPARK